MSQEDGQEYDPIRVLREVQATSGAAQRRRQQGKDIVFLSKLVGPKGRISWDQHGLCALRRLQAHLAVSETANSGVTDPSCPCDRVASG